MLVGGLFYDAAIFVGGESPVNYPRKRRREMAKQTKEKAAMGWDGGFSRRILGWGFKEELGKEG